MPSLPSPDHHSPLFSFPTRRSSDLAFISSEKIMNNTSPIAADFRFRRLRRTGALRDLVRETRLHPSDFIRPIFVQEGIQEPVAIDRDRKSTRLNSSHVAISYAVLALTRPPLTSVLFPYTTLFRSGFYFK